MPGMLRICLLICVFPAAAGWAGPAAGADLEEVGELIIRRTNEFREERGLERVRADRALSRAAEQFAGFMARTGKYGHHADGRAPAERAGEAGYDYCLVMENIGMQFSPEELAGGQLAEKFMRGWIESAGHRRNLSDPDVLHIGVGVARSPESGEYFAVQLLGRPESAMISFRISNQSGRMARYTVDDQQFTIQPRQIRTHGACRPPRLAFATEPGRVYHPRAGAEYALVAGAEGVRVRTGEAIPPADGGAGGASGGGE
jgi:uncharacterized protein YkwD